MCCGQLFHPNSADVRSAAIAAPGRPTRILDGVELGKRRVEVAAEPEVEESSGNGKGRPTPKRRDTVGVRGPVSAPKTRKEAYARQRELAKTQRTAQRTPAANLTVAQRRELLRQGDPSVLPRRDRGQTRSLARDWVDSRRMASNYLLILFPLVIIGYALPIMQIVVLVLFLGLLVEWYLAGRRICGAGQGALRQGRGQPADHRLLRRRPRLPAAQVAHARPAGRARRRDLTPRQAPSAPPAPAHARVINSSIWSISDQNRELITG